MTRKDAESGAEIVSALRWIEKLRELITPIAPKEGEDLFMPTFGLRDRSDELARHLAYPPAGVSVFVAKIQEDFRARLGEMAEQLMKELNADLERL